MRPDTKERHDYLMELGARALTVLLVAGCCVLFFFGTMFALYLVDTFVVAKILAMFCLGVLFAIVISSSRA